MSLKEGLTKYDSFTAINRGIDSGRDPALIGSDQVAFLVNATSRSGFIGNRPGWARIALTGDNFQLGRWQGAGTYISESGHPYLIASIGGHIVRFDPISNQVTNLSTTFALTNASNLPKAWFVQAEIYFLIQDNSAIPLIYDGSTLRRANPVAFGGNEFPTGNVMEYNNGRLWVALPDKRSFVGGDLAYSVTGTVYDVLTETQNQFLTSGSFALPSTAGFITGMKTVAVQDSVLGQGPLIVFGQYGSAAVNAPFDAAQWQTLASPIETVCLVSQGPTSQESIVNINGDLWYRSRDGVRSFMVARRDHGTWVNTPLSHEIERVLDRDDPYLLQFASAVDFDNRRLETVSPYRATFSGVEHGTGWRGLSVLDFKPVSSMFERTQPCWDGLWNGLSILQILTVNCYGIDRCFMFTLSAAHEIELWELSRTNQFDNLVDLIQWQIETRSMGFDDKAELLKRLERTETWFEQLAGSLAYRIRYRPDAYGGWIDLDAGSFCAQTGMCTPPTCTPPQGPMKQYRPRKLSSGPNESCEGCVDKKFHTGFEYQFQLALTGAASVSRFRAVATEVPEDTVGGCLGDEEECCSETGCESNPWEYQTPDDSDPVITPPDNGPPFPPERIGGCVGVPAIESFLASDTEITAGDPVTLSWGPVTNASACSIDNGIGAIPASPSSVIVTPLVTTTYVMTATCGTYVVTNSVTIYVGTPPPAEPEVLFIPDGGVPSMECSPPTDWTYYEASLSLRSAGFATVDQNPNEVLDPALIAWWAAKIQQEFIASGTPYTSFKLYWVWSNVGDSWSAQFLYAYSGHVHYFTPGWTIVIAYCNGP